MRTIRIGMIQMKVIFHEPAQNLARARTLCRQAASDGAEICILPECMDLGWGTPHAAALADPIPGRTSDALCQIARECGIWLVSGITEQDGDRVYNAALLISDEGRIMHKHRKINLLTGVEDVYAVGDRLGVTETPFGTIGISICADNAIQSTCLGDSLARMGAQMILSPCAWAVKPDRNISIEPYGNEWHAPYGKLSSAYGIPVVGVSNVGDVSEGTWKGWHAIGHSIAYAAYGSCQVILPYGKDAETVHILETVIQPPARLGTALAEHVYSLS